MSKTNCASCMNCRSKEVNATMLPPIEGAINNFLSFIYSFSDETTRAEILARLSVSICLADPKLSKYANAIHEQLDGMTKDHYIENPEFTETVVKRGVTVEQLTAVNTIEHICGKDPVIGMRFKKTVAEQKTKAAKYDSLLAEYEEAIKSGDDTRISAAIKAVAESQDISLNDLLSSLGVKGS